MEAPRMLGTVEVSELLGKHRTTIVRWARSGRLPLAVEVPGYRGDFLFDRASIEALQEEKS